jgi:ribosomal protein L12E/L44/L45/RPP1/RPP2
MSEQKKKLLENLAEITKSMSEEGLEKLQVFAAGVSAGAACAKPGASAADAAQDKPEKEEKKEE